MVANRRSELVVCGVLLSITLSANVLWGRTDARARWAGTGMNTAPISVWQAAELAARVYQPEASPLPEPLVLVQTVESSSSGLYAEFLLVRPSAASDPVAGEHLIVAVRGTELDRAFTSRSAFFADLTAAAAGGRPQWETLRDPLIGYLQSRQVARVTLIGHSLGGMVAQLAAVECMRNQPELAVSAFLFCSPGVLQARDGSDSSTAPDGSNRLQIMHVVHAQDMVPRLSLLGSHSPLTQWHLLDNTTTSPHSVATILAYLEAHAGVLPPRLSPEQIVAYLTVPDETRRQ